jgi:insulysin
LEDTLDRELQAVDSENKKNLQSDPWRLQQLNRSTSGKQHPYHKFSTGNYKLLHDDPIGRGVKIREAFIDFYKDHYSANRMKLAVLGRESLDELESWVQEFFSDVPNQALPKLRWDGIPICDKENIGTQMFVKPVMDQRMLDMFFPYPDEEDLYASRPGRYISHLIGHEGPGSILAYIKNKGWATSLSAGVNPICPGSAIFGVSTRLTEFGLKNYSEIVKVIFQYIAMIKEQPPQEWIVDEMMRLAEVDFKFRQKSPASRTVSGLSGTMQRPYPRDQLLSAQALIRKFNPEAIKVGLDALNSNNFRLSVVSQDYADIVDRKEKWYGTEYKYEKIPSNVMEEIRKAASSSPNERPAELHLPAVNEFVPQRLDVEKKEVKEPSRTPTLIRNDDNVRTWWKKDDQFWVPKANVHVYLRSPVVGVTPLVAVMGQLYKELVEDSLMEYAYDAEIAGLDYHTAALSNGFDVTIAGYNDKMPVLLEKVLVSMRDLEIRDDRFDIIKERLMRGYKNFEYQEPYTQSMSYARYVTSESSWTTFELLQELNNVTAEDVRQFFPQALRQMHIEILVHGNMYKEDALHITNLVESTLRPKRLPSSQWTTRRTIELPRGSDYRYERVLKNPDNINHCVDYLIFIGDDADRAQRAKLLLLAQMGEEPVFDTLRTKEQLGYVVGSNSMVNVTLTAWRILVQSEKDCGYLEKRIDNFLAEFERQIRDMPDEEFEAHKIGLINKRLERMKNLNQETARFWTHITKEGFDFELGEQFC